MRLGTELPRSVRFENWELDARAGELRTENQRVRLQQQPLRLLMLLLDHAGDVVTREELHSKLWPADTYVDFEDGLNHAVRKLREALGDTAGKPRFIETLPRRGYRFIARVESVARESSPAAVGAVSDRQTAMRTSSVQRPWAITLAGTTLLTAALVLGLVVRTPRAPRVLGIHQITHTGRLKPCPPFTDGARIYFTDVVDGHFTPMMIPTGGGDAVPISTQFKDAIVGDLTPDNSELMLVVPGPDGFSVWHLPVGGGSARKSGDLGVDDAIDTPDGRGLLYAKGCDFWVAKSDGTESRKLFSVPGCTLLQNPRYSRDATRLSWTDWDPKTGNQWLWEATAGGSNPHRFLLQWNPHGYTCCGDWTPDGKYFVFAALVSTEWDLWALREPGFFSRGGRTPIKLTSGPLNSMLPAISKDGRQVFFSGSDSRAELSVYDSSLREFVPYLGGISAESVSFSRDGQWVAYVRLPEGTLWRSKTDGNDRLQLTFLPVKAYLPRWSPDGKRIVFSDIATPQRSKVCLISADGGSPVPVTSGKHNEGDPTWSPDGKSLMLHYLNNSSDSTIEELNLDTGRVTELPISEGIFSPRWSPDGQYVAGLTQGDRKLMLFDFKTEKWHKLGEIQVNFPNWSNDGRYLFFEGEIQTGEATGFYRINIATHKIDVTANLGNAHQFLWGGFGPGAPWAGVSPDGSVLIAREAGTTEIYALDVDFPD